MVKQKAFIVLINYQSATDTIECLSSLFELQESYFQVLIIDNSPDNQSLDSIERWLNHRIGQNPSESEVEKKINETSEDNTYIRLPQLKFLHQTAIQEKIILVKAIENKGFAAANNIAFKYLMNNKENFLCWILNNDTIVKSTALSEILTFFHQNQNVEFLGTTLMEYYQKDKVQSIAGAYNPKFGSLKIIKEKDDINETNKIIYPNGASMIVTRKFIEDVGFMSEDYFLYFEELDWVVRSRKVGIEPQILDSNFVFHKGGGSTGRRNDFVSFYYLRSRFLFTLKYFRNRVALVFLATMIVFPFNCLNRREFPNLWLPVKSFFSALKAINH